MRQWFSAQKVVQYFSQSLVQNMVVCDSVQARNQQMFSHVALCNLFVQVWQVIHSLVYERYTCWDNCLQWLDNYFVIQKEK
jgi:hypothetical protein